MALADLLVAATVRPVVVGFLDIKDDPIRGWSGLGAFAPTETGDSDLDGETFVEAEGAVEISDFTEDMGIGGPVTVKFSAAEFDDEAIVQQLIADRRVFQGRKAKFWRFFLTNDESSVHPEYEVLFSGVMTSAESTRQTGQPAVISITCDQDLQKANAPPVRWIDHQVFNPGDTAVSFMNDLSRAGVASAVAAAARERQRSYDLLNQPNTGMGYNPYNGFY